MKYLFITGLRRSGTTAVANFLNSQEEITVYRDYLNFLRQIPMLYKIEDLERRKNILLRNAKSEIQSIVGITPELRYEKDYKIYDIYKDCLDPIKEKGDVMIGHKITESLPIAKLFLEEDNFKCIYVLRDVRDVIGSAKNYILDYDIVKQVKLWKDEILEINNLSNKNNFLVIKYDDFVKQSNKKEIEQFIQQKINWNIKEFKDRKSPEWVGNTSYSEYENKDLKGIYSKSLQKWPSKINNDEDIQYAEYICRTELLDLGYELSNIQYSFFEKLKFNFRKRSSHSKQILKDLIRKVL